MLDFYLLLSPFLCSFRRWLRSAFRGLFSKLRQYFFTIFRTFSVFLIKTTRKVRSRNLYKSLRVKRRDMGWSDQHSWLFSTLVRFAFIWILPFLISLILSVFSAFCHSSLSSSQPFNHSIGDAGLILYRRLKVLNKHYHFSLPMRILST